MLLDVVQRQKENDYFKQGLKNVLLSKQFFVQNFI